MNNKTAVSCGDCANHTQSNTDDCKCFPIEHLRDKTGLRGFWAPYETCSAAREREALCGASGKRFIPKTSLWNTIKKKVYTL